MNIESLVMKAIEDGDGIQVSSNVGSERFPLSRWTAEPGSG